MADYSSECSLLDSEKLADTNFNFLIWPTNYVLTVQLQKKLPQENGSTELG